MQQFALISVYPRSIVWLIRLGEWERFEEIIKYNCAMVGGYFNVMIPLTEQDGISKEYQHFLADYDPDLIVLAPGMTSSQLDFLASRLYPFAIISWESVTGIASLDALSGTSGRNVTMGHEARKMSSESKNFISAFVAVADNAYPDTSRLALVACGDTEPREPMFSVMDDDVELDTTGYREFFLRKLLKSEYKHHSAGAYLQNGNEFVPAPNRYQLSELIAEEHQFPLSGAAEILKICYKLQYHVDIYQSFVGLTANYRRGGTVTRTYKHKGKDTPSAIVLVSNSFGLEDALLFWNLRASGFMIAWLSFEELEKSADAVVKWLESDYGGIFYACMIGRGLDVVFSSPDKDITQLRILFDIIHQKRQETHPQWRVVTYDYLVFYDYVRHFLKQERVVLASNASVYTFIPKLPQTNLYGEYAGALEWNGLMLPQNSTLVHDGISSVTIDGFALSRLQKQSLPLSISKFRINKNRYLTAQVSSETPIDFRRPSPVQTIKTLFTTAEFSRIEPSSTARYHQNFVERAGGLEQAAYYLATSPYHELLELLADNSSRNKSGWILNYPSIRRALHHLHLWKVPGKPIPTETQQYFDTISDILPNEAAELLEKEILERGFRLVCDSCSYNSWYPAEHVGQTFKCTRCYQTQVYKSNPLWLYKLVEVVFRGFEDNMQVPLLALNYLKRKSLHCFEWIPDSDVYWVANGQEQHKNVDILCISDGRLYIGEAKSNDEIKADQFSFYEKVCQRVSVDGVVFATSQAQWGRGTLQRIERLKAWFEGEVLILTEKDLYTS